MRYAIQITPNSEISIHKFENYHTINDLVDGWYETCGYFGVRDKMLMLFCNEEFLFRDSMEFNAVASALANQPIYGNIVLLEIGRNEDGEKDSIPLCEKDAIGIKVAMDNFKKAYKTMLAKLTLRYANNKPKPIAKVVTLTEEEFSEVLFGDETDDRET